MLLLGIDGEEVTKEQMLVLLIQFDCHLNSRIELVLNMMNTL
jgi:hypothetical protein